MQNKNLSLRPYLQEIERYCHQLDRKQMTQLILGLARQIDAQNRQKYLDTFHSILPQAGREQSSVSDYDFSPLLADITELQEKVRCRLESIEDYSYWDDPDEGDWEDDYYDEDSPPPLSSDQIEELNNCLGKANNIFITADKQGARMVYGALFSLIDEASCYGYMPEMEIDLYETRARYIRCIYDLEPLERKGEAVLAAMYPTPREDDCEGIMPDDLPFLQDVIDALPDEPEGLESFLPIWSGILALLNFRDDRIADLRLEAAYLEKGLDEVGHLVRKWGKEQPKGCIFWLKLLQNEKQWSQLKESAHLVLEILPAGRHRHKASEYLARAAEQLEDTETLLDGCREGFHSLPGRDTLIPLLIEAQRQQKRTEELNGALDFCTENISECGNDLITRILIMSGKFAEAFSREKNAEPVGWTINNTGLVYFSTLYLLCKGSPDCILIDEGLHFYADECCLHFTGFSGQTCDSAATYREIITGLEGIILTDEECSRYWSWCRNMADKRIRDILANKYRSAYDRAALVLAALAESLILTDRPNEAKALLQSYCCVEFNRFSAFRRETRQVVGRSSLMRGWEKEL